jgi:hypothetical protein
MYLLFAVYAPGVCAKGEELLACEPNTAALGSFGVFESVDNILLFLNAELHKEIGTREWSGKVQAIQSKLYHTVYPGDVAQTPPARPKIAAFWTFPVPTRFVST